MVESKRDTTLFLRGARWYSYALMARPVALSRFFSFKTEKAHDPYLEINNIFGRNYDASNAGTQDKQGNEKRRDDPALEPSICKNRRFKIMKYSFNANEEYIAIKESECLNHSKDNLDAYREILRNIDKGWVVAIPDEE
ncbi:hypothetical protein Tco_0788087 [Tanacetum coccineum]